MPLYDRLENWFIHLSQVMFLIEMTAQLLLPCILMEMIKEQLECTRIALNHRMLKETGIKYYMSSDDNHTGISEIKHHKDRYQLLQYMSTRPLCHKAWRVIPLDMQLPLAVLSTCVTYLIVIIQFTHLY
ncbi:hypothetical protein NE865_14343 [Phthorimaea operculella]|nr:hypothetical protein NE865_14343 [Phthorimaea operculella]